jgi:hypothetical protein
MEPSIPSRGAAVRIAAHLGFPSLPEISDRTARAWGRGSSSLREGNLDAPLSDVTHAYAAESEVLALGAACRDLGLGGALEIATPMLEVRPEALRFVEESGGDVVIPYRPQRGQGEGTLRFRDVNGEARVEQTVHVADWVVQRSRFPLGETVDYTLARGHVPALSPRGRAIACERRVCRDRTLRASPEVLRALLRERVIVVR